MTHPSAVAPAPRGERARTGIGPAELTTPHAVRSRRGDGSAALPAGAALPDVARSLQEVTAEANAHARAGPAWPGVQPLRHRRVRRAQEQTHRSIFAPPAGVPVAQRSHQSPRRSHIAGSQRGRPGGTAPQGRRAASLGARRNDSPGGLRAARLPWSTWIAVGALRARAAPRPTASGARVIGEASGAPACHRALPHAPDCLLAPLPSRSADTAQQPR